MDIGESLFVLFVLKSVASCLLLLFLPPIFSAVSLGSGETFR